MKNPYFVPCLMCAAMWGMMSFPAQAMAEMLKKEEKKKPKIRYTPVYKPGMVYHTATSLVKEHMKKKHKPKKPQRQEVQIEDVSDGKL